jgi:hypothetical protein
MILYFVACFYNLQTHYYKVVRYFYNLKMHYITFAKYELSLKYALRANSIYLFIQKGKQNKGNSPYNAIYSSSSSSSSSAFSKASASAKAAAASSNSNSPWRRRREAYVPARNPANNSSSLLAGRKGAHTRTAGTATRTDPVVGGGGAGAG